MCENTTNLDNSKKEFNDINKEVKTRVTDNSMTTDLSLPAHENDLPELESIKVINAKNFIHGFNISGM
jgi:uncharacterized protein YkvS